MVGMSGRGRGVRGTAERRDGGVQLTVSHVWDGGEHQGKVGECVAGARVGRCSLDVDQLWGAAAERFGVGAGRCWQRLRGDWPWMQLLELRGTEAGRLQGRRRGGMVGVCLWGGGWGQGWQGGRRVRG